MRETTIQIDLATTHQTIDGFGVNINPVGHWRDGALRPVIDQLIDDLGASIFRLDPYGFTNWIDPDGTGGPETLNSDSLAAAYQGAAFRDAWALGRYLNERGAEFILNVSGIVPPWMCANDGVTLTDFDAYVELVSSLAVWAREKEGLRFTLLGPFNETDIGPPEGPFLDADGLVETTTRLAARLNELGHGDIRFVLADQSSFNLDYVRVIAAATQLREVVSVVGMHSYSDRDCSPIPDFLAEHGLTDWRFWMTEYGEIEQTGEVEWQAAVNSNRRLIGALNDGARAALVWDAYDNFHGHDDCWTIWGIMRTAYGLYTPKKRYHGAKHVYRLVPPGSKRVEVDAQGEPIFLAAFLTPTGGFTLVGLNESDTAVSVELAIVGGEIDPAPVQVHVTDQTRNFEPIARFPASANFALTIPANSIFSVSTHSVDCPHRGIAPSNYSGEPAWLPASAVSAAKRAAAARQ